MVRKTFDVLTLHLARCSFDTVSLGHEGTLMASVNSAICKLRCLVLLDCLLAFFCRSDGVTAMLSCFHRERVCADPSSTPSQCSVLQFCVCMYGLTV